VGIGGEVCRPHAGQVLEVLSAAVNASSVSTSSISPTCWLSHAYRPQGERERVLQVGADGEGRRYVHGQRHGQRRVSARAADRQFLPVDEAHHRVVARHVDRAVVGEPAVDERGRGGRARGRRR
jgi:hypothetical protein